MLQTWNQPVGGACDASGNATIQVKSAAGHWSAVYLAIEVSAGNPTYVIRESRTGGLPIIFGFGQGTMIGPVILAPNQSLAISVSGAAALANVDGQFIGWIADAPQELPPALPAASSVFIAGGSVTATISSGTVSISGTPTVQFAPGQNVTFTNSQIQVLNVAGNLLNTEQPPTSLGSFTVSGPAGTVTSQSVTPPTATHTLMIATVGTCSVDVIGNTTGVYYTVRSFPLGTSMGVARPSTNWRVNINTAVDSAYTIKVTSNQTPNFTAYVSAVLSTGCVVIKTDLADPIRVAGRVDTRHQTFSGSGSDAAGTFVNLFTGPGTGSAITKLILSGQANPGGLFIITFQGRGNVSGNTVTIAQMEVSGPGQTVVLDFEDQPWQWANDSWVGATDGQILIDAKGNGLATAFFACTLWAEVN